jgi:chromosomal replication initiator protein
MKDRNLWMAVLKRLVPTLKQNLTAWFQNSAVEIIELEDGKRLARVFAPTSFHRKWIDERYSKFVLNALKAEDANISKIEVVVGQLDESETIDLKSLVGGKLDKKVRKVRNANEVAVYKPGSNKRVDSKMLNQRYGLDNFVVGKDNRLPHAAAQAVVKVPGGIYNPLYIYGEVGLGKTHLLQAIGNGVLKYHPDKIVKYITAERFVSEVIDAISKRKMKQFKDTYRDVDCFLIDDVQFFARKNSSQQELFYTFNELYEAGKQIVLTSDRCPSELDDLDDRLTSRFGMGMVVELVVPDYETRLAILQQKASENQIIVDPDILAFIAENVKDNVRALEGVLRQVLAEQQLTNSVPTLRSIANILQRMNKAKEIVGFEVKAKAKQIVKSPTQLMNLVADYYHVSVDDLVGKARQKSIMRPRQVCMYLIKKELGYSFEKIGTGFGGRNHTTVMHACNKIEDLLDTDVRVMRDVREIKGKMGL